MTGSHLSWTYPRGKYISKTKIYYVCFVMREWRTHLTCSLFTLWLNNFGGDGTTCLASQWLTLNQPRHTFGRIRVGSWELNLRIDDVQFCGWSGHREIILCLKGNCLIFSKCGIKYCFTLGRGLKHLKRTFALISSSGKWILVAASQFDFSMFILGVCLGELVFRKTFYLLLCSARLYKERFSLCWGASFYFDRFTLK